MLQHSIGIPRIWPQACETSSACRSLFWRLFMKTILLNVSVHYFAFTHKRILELCPYSCIQSCLILLSCCVLFHTIVCHCPVDGISLFSMSHTVPHTILQSTSLCIFMLLLLWDMYQEVEVLRGLFVCLFVLIKYVYLLLSCCYVSGTMLGVLQKQSHLLLLPSYKWEI